MTPSKEPDNCVAGQEMPLSCLDPKGLLVCNVVGLVWSEDRESCASSSVVTGRVSHARQVKAGDPNEEGYPGPPGWELGMRLTTSPHKEGLCQAHHKNVSEGTRENKGAFLGGGQGPEGAEAPYIDGWMDGLTFYFKIVCGVWKKHTKL